jgi:methionyl-tRNA formyltransferase
MRRRNIEMSKHRNIENNNTTMTKNDLRIVFMGTPEFAVETLRMLVENDYNVVAVVTQPDKPVGRHGSVLQPSPVKRYSVEHGLPVLQPEKMKDPQFVEQLRSYHANLQVVVAFRMLPEVVWAMPEYGTFNVHAALLPQYRGAAPINWAVINGETETGGTTFFLDHDIDTGRIIMKKPFPIPDDADVEYVYDGLMHLGALLCLETLETIVAADGHPETTAQPIVADGFPISTAPKIFKETCEIDWQRSAKQVYDFVRGLSPVPGAWTTLLTPDGKDTVLKIYKTRKTSRSAEGSRQLAVDGKSLYVSAADEWLEVVELQLAGKKRMTAHDFLNGMKNLSEYRIK